MGWRDLRGSASLWLAAVSVAVMLLVTVVPGLHDQWIVGGGFVPIRVDVAVEAPVALLPVWLTPLSASFIHGDWMHLIFNMVVLLWCGRYVEAAIGRGGLVALYVLGAYAAALSEYLWAPLSIVPGIGASGATSAIFGAFALAYGKPKQVTGKPGPDRAIHAVWLLAFWLLIQWMVSVVSEAQGQNIATVAHGGGFIAGLIAFPLLLRAAGRVFRA